MNVKSRSVLGAGLLVIGLVIALVVPVSPAAAGTPFVCRNASGGTSGFVGHITDVRLGQHATFDRFVIQFRGGRVPVFHVTRQSTSQFALDASGRIVTLRGHAGIRIGLPRASAMGSYHGRRDFRPPFVQLREARELGDFEAATSWGLGIHRQSCMRVFTLAAPGRLVVDVPH